MTVTLLGVKDGVAVKLLKGRVLRQERQKIVVATFSQPSASGILLGNGYTLQRHDFNVTNP